MPTKVKWIEEVPASQIKPRFGFAWTDGVIQINRDLPKAMKNFLSVHERHHIEDRKKGDSVLTEELKANLWAAFLHPWGAFLVIVYSLSWYRLKYYYERLKGRMN